jgi:hypothetical protein
MEFGWGVLHKKSSVKHQLRMILHQLKRLVNT